MDTADDRSVTWRDVLRVTWLVFWRSTILFGAVWCGVSRQFLADASEVQRIGVGAILVFAALFAAVNMALIKEYKTFAIKLARKAS